MSISIQLILKIFLVRMRISTRKTRYRYCIDLVVNLFAGNNNAYLSRERGGLRVSFSRLLSSNVSFVDIFTKLNVFSSIEISSFQCRLASDNIYENIFLYFCKFAFLNNKLQIKTVFVPSCLYPLGLLDKVLPDSTVRFNFGYPHSDWQ